MIKKYIRGNKERGAEVIKKLEELGGINEVKYDGDCVSLLYFIDKHGKIITTESTSHMADMLIEYFEEIKLEEKPKYKVKVKESKQIYWFKATKDDTKNQALFDKLYSLVGINKCDIRVDEGIVCFNPLKNSTMFYPNQHVTSSIECTIAMMVGKELVIE